MILQSPFQYRKLIPVLLWVHFSLAWSSPHSDSPLDQLNEEIRWLQAESYVITATKTYEKMDKSGSVVSVITARDLQNMGARDLMDALKRIPGIGITQSNTGITEIEVRGIKTTFSEKVLLLINGHATNNNLVNGGAFSAYDRLAIKDIARVEIVRGPGSALYGANAFVATINVITKHSAEVNAVNLSLGYGTFNRSQVNLLAGNGKSQAAIKNGELGVVVNLFALDTDGFRGQVDSDAIKNAGRSNYWNRKYDFSLNVAYKDYALQGKYVKRQAGPYLGVASALADGSKQDYVDYFLELSMDKAITDSLELKAKTYFDHFQFDNRWTLFPKGFGNGAFPEGVLARTPVKNNKIGIEVQVNYNFADWNKLTAGASFEYQRQHGVRFWANFNPLTSTPLGSFQDISAHWNWNGNHRRQIKAVFLQDIWDINDNLRLITGGRYDHYSDFGGTFNPRTSLTWEFVQNYDLVLSYGSAFRAPTFGELFNTNNPAILGNPNVRPEKIDTLEASLNAKLAAGTQLRMTFFRNKIKDIISKTSSSEAVNVSGNVGRVTVKGIEFEIKSQFLDGLDIAVNYTYQQPRDDMTGNFLPEVSKNKANLALNYNYSGNWNFYTGILYKGKTTRAIADTRSKVPGYFTVDFAVNAKDIVKNLNVTASLYNALDKTYFDPSPAGVMNSDFPKAGRSLFVEVDYQF